MNKKEIAEIKKQFTPQNCALTRLCACYVDGEKNKKSEMKEAFLSQSEEECFKSVSYTHLAGNHSGRADSARFLHH